MITIADRFGGRQEPDTAPIATRRRHDATATGVRPHRPGRAGHRRQPRPRPRDGRRLRRAPAPTSSSPAATATACAEFAAEVARGDRRARRSGIGAHVGRWDALDGARRRARTTSSARSTSWSTTPACRRSTTSSTDVTEELFDKVLGVNLKGPFRLTALVGTRMAAGDGGSIINISSAGAVRPRPAILPYAAAKAGLNALTVGLRAHLRPLGAGQRDHGRHVPHRRQQGVGHGGVRRAGAERSPPSAAASPTRSWARRSTWPATRPVVHDRLDPHRRRRPALAGGGPAVPPRTSSRDGDCRRTGPLGEALISAPTAQQLGQHLVGVLADRGHAVVGRPGVPLAGAAPARASGPGRAPRCRSARPACAPGSAGPRRCRWRR